LRAAVIGATGGLGRALTEGFAQLGYEVMLQGRHEQDLNRLKSDLEIVYGVRVDLVIGDLTKDDTIDACCRTFNEQPIDVLALASVTTHEEDDGRLTSEQIDTIYNVNVLSSIKLIHYILPQFMESGGLILGVGSIATCRGRGANMVYSSSKVALEMMFDGLMHRCVSSKARVHFYQLGYMDTRNTAHLKTILPIVSPQDVVAMMLNQRLKKRVKEVYPRFWSFVMLALKMMPWFLFKRMKF
jgi:short-subunit dehydrogenase